MIRFAAWFVMMFSMFSSGTRCGSTHIGFDDMDYPLAEAEHQHDVSARLLREWEDYTLDPPLLDLSGQIAEQQWRNWSLWEVSQVCRYADPSIDGNREEDKYRGDGFRQHSGRGECVLLQHTRPGV